MEDKNNHRLLSSIHSAITPRKRHKSTQLKVSRQRSIDKHGTHQRRKRRHSTKSMTIIHTKIRPQSHATSEYQRNIDTLPSVRSIESLD